MAYAQDKDYSNLLIPKGPAKTFNTGPLSGSLSASGRGVNIISPWTGSGLTASL
jgi:hypothetical protein